MRAAVSAALLLAALPAAAEPARVALGEIVYEDNCFACHGPTGTEGEAGDIRDLGLATITGAVRGGMGDMPTFALTAAEIAAVAAYLNDLRKRVP